MGIIIYIAAIVAGISFIVGYLRFIVDENGNIPLNSYRLTGWLGMVLFGMFKGSKELICLRKITPDALSAMMIYLSIGIFLIIF